MIVCSRAQSGDAAALAALHATDFTRGWSSDEFADLLRAPECCGFVARHFVDRNGDDASFVGFVVARSAAEEAEILTIAVAEEHRRRGIARAMMTALFDHLARHGVAIAFLEAGTDNVPARRLYRSLGFTQVGLRPGYYGDNRRNSARGDAVVLRAPVAAPATVQKGSKTDYEFMS